MVADLANAVNRVNAETEVRETLVGGEIGEAMSLDDYVQAIGLPSGGAVRASLGPSSNAADLDRFAAFAREFVDLVAVPDDLPPRTACGARSLEAPGRVSAAGSEERDGLAAARPGVDLRVCGFEERARLTLQTGTGRKIECEEEAEQEARLLPDVRVRELAPTDGAF